MAKKCGCKGGERVVIYCGEDPIPTTLAEIAQKLKTIPDKAQEEFDTVKATFQKALETKDKPLEQSAIELLRWHTATMLSAAMNLQESKTVYADFKKQLDRWEKLDEKEAKKKFTKWLGSIHEVLTDKTLERAGNSYHNTNPIAHVEELIRTNMLKLQLTEITKICNLFQLMCEPKSKKPEVLKVESTE